MVSGLNVSVCPQSMFHTCSAFCLDFWKNISSSWQGMIEKFPKIPYDRELDIASPAAWQGDIEICLSDAKGSVLFFPHSGKS